MLTVTQRIGWDPVADHIRSWEFDSEGGFGEGKWGGDGEPLGGEANGHAAGRRDRFGHEHIGQGTPRPGALEVDRPHCRGESIPDDETFAFVRVPPFPRAHAEGPANPAPATNREGRPQ